MKMNQRLFRGLTWPNGHIAKTLRVKIFSVLVLLLLSNSQLALSSQVGTLNSAFVILSVQSAPREKLVFIGSPAAVVVGQINANLMMSK